MINRRRAPTAAILSILGPEVGGPVYRPRCLAWLEHLPRGIDWAFMINTSVRPNAEANGPTAREIIRQIGEVAQSLRQWPKLDLFARSS